jgi:hypothetical protein
VQLHGHLEVLESKPFVIEFFSVYIDWPTATRSIFMSTPALSYTPKSFLGRQTDSGFFGEKMYLVAIETIIGFCYIPV